MNPNPKTNLHGPNPPLPPDVQPDVQPDPMPPPEHDDVPGLPEPYRHPDGDPPGHAPPEHEPPGQPPPIRASRPRGDSERRTR